VRIGIMNKLVMSVSKQDLTHDDEAYQDLIKEWGERVTVVDFGYDSKGQLSTAMMIVHYGLIEIHAEHLYSKPIQENQFPLSIEDLIQYYVPVPD
tara:strand:- start:150 stop:434 length:285 start_codon:yes stop_codon:yes gene_type:complete